MKESEIHGDIRVELHRQPMRFGQELHLTDALGELDRLLSLVESENSLPQPSRT